MSDNEKRLSDPAFQHLLKVRNRWRWGLSGLVIGAYLVYSVAGVYFPTAFATPVPGSSIPWGMAIGLLIIALSILLSILYIGIVSKIELRESQNRARSS